MLLKNTDPRHKTTIILGGITVLLLILVITMMFINGDIVFFSVLQDTFKNLWWVILPIPVWKIFYLVWEEYIDLMWAVATPRITLEIIPPADTEKGPKIMEQIFHGLHTQSSLNKFEIYCGWRTNQDKFSFEIASHEGSVHFYINCPATTRNNVEAQIYAQYPDTEIFQVEDYVWSHTPKNLPNVEWDVWGTTLKLVSEDQLPIRTHKHFKEEITGVMIDPLSSLTEVMSAIGKDQHVWFQIVFTPLHERDWHPQSMDYINKLIGKGESEKTKKSFFGYLGEFFVLPGNILRGMLVEEAELIAPEMGSTEEIVKNDFNINKLSPDEQERVKAVYENISKIAFGTTMRFVYTGKRDGFNKALGVAGVMGAIKQFGDTNLNALYPDPRSKTFALYGFTDSRLAFRQRRVVQNFRDRSFSQGKFVFNIEELATVYHFPDMSVKSPNVSRVDAKKGSAPANLPIEFESSLQ
ncbi:hypothetical protein HN784_04590 [bacterium]|jgi:hypothetical protein|nr:hypothetical protein [bacterium]MBT4251452.1 hypothetical protein [bacterium]MBT4597426.1 hypothetical protein [bacterium]MBT6754265.1 hypothetical protein [bacterium]MBT7037591.1 hypothetical protein [bacterium]